MKKSLYEPRSLTYEEHKRIEEFLRNFHDEGKIVFDLLRQGFGDYQKPIINMAEAINSMSILALLCQDKSELDRVGDYEDVKEWYTLYRGIGHWTTEGWK